MSAASDEVVLTVARLADDSGRFVVFDSCSLVFRDDLTTIAEAKSYAWDAATSLLREGFEIVLDDLLRPLQ